jgi:hypothetical protein
MPTEKQNRAIKIYVENHGRLSVSESMRRAGYSAATAKNPKQLTESMDWQQAMDRFLPDDVLLKKHKQLMNARKIERAEFPGYIPQETIREILTDAGCKPRNFEQNPMTGIISVWYWAPDTRAQAMALDLAYKLKGKMTQKIEHTGEVPVALVEFLGDDDTSPSHDPVS